MSKLYLENGYLNIDYILSKGRSFNFVYGGRGVGKTYGVLRWMIEHKEPFIYLRRLQTEVNLIQSDAFNPFGQINKDLGLNIMPHHIPKTDNAVFTNDDTGEEICYTGALSKVGAIRGFGASGVNYILYDEFIPGPNDRKIRDEWQSLEHAYESVNRNRELAGMRPVQLIACANSFTLANPIFMGLKCVEMTQHMRETGQEIGLWRRNYMLVDCVKSPISEQKKSTVLYNALDADDDMLRISVGNEFLGANTDYIGSFPLKELTPVVVVGEVCLYKHKSNNMMYCSFHKAGNPPVYRSDLESLRRWKYRYDYVVDKYLDGKLLFENYSAKALLTNYLESC